MTLTEFLLARITEDEAWAARIVAELGAIDGGELVVASPHRVLAECEAKRRIVERVEQKRARCNVTTTLLEIMLDLAQPYADHPDYQPEWKP